MKLNNKGFTLVELLAVLVILIAISSIAIPTISSSLDRSKDKQTKAKEKLLESAAELYVTDHRNNLNSQPCYITLNKLKEENYIDEDALDNGNNGIITGVIVYQNNKLTFQKTPSGSQC